MRLLKMQKGLDYFKDKPRPNLKKTESINLGTSKETKETKISIYAKQNT